jgi:hypothetical protein
VKRPWPWREPREESTDLYPGLVVHDGRVSGSITVGRTRLPLWAFIGWAIRDGFKVAAADYYDDHPEYTNFGEAEMAEFLHCLMEQRGEFGRLILLLADAERCEARGNGKPWWETKRHRKRLVDQMERCIAALSTAPAAVSVSEHPKGER